MLPSPLSRYQTFILSHCCSKAWVSAISSILVRGQSFTIFFNFYFTKSLIDLSPWNSYLGLLNIFLKTLVEARELRLSWSVTVTGITFIDVVNGTVY